jgi:ABC-type lipoprotein release transport system permease subunit
VLSSTIADKLKTALRKKVVVTFQNTDLDITTGAFRVAGIFDTGNKLVDEIQAYVRIGDLLPLTDLPEGSGHEIAVLLHHMDSTESLQKKMLDEFPDLLVRTFREIAPDLDLYDSQIQISVIIMTIIIMLALIFGIINTMLMAVLERVRELGMLMAIGMTRIRIFLMIVWETLFLAIIGAPVGMFIGYLTIEGLQIRGIDLSIWSKGLAQFGMSPILYPELGSESYVFIAISVVITALLGSIYPSVKAIRLRPVEALRKI